MHKTSYLSGCGNCTRDVYKRQALPALLVLAVFYGIYRYSRNPAFLGFDLMYAGVLLLYGNLLTLGFSCLLYTSRCV